MKATLIFSTLAVLGSPFATAQNVTGEPAPDPVLEAIQEFKKYDQETAEIVAATPVPLTPPPPVENAAPASPEPTETVTASDAPTSTAEPVVDEQETLPTVEEPPPKPADDLTVRVEKMHAGNNRIDPSEVKLLAPYPAKPLAQAPAGWQLDGTNDAPPFVREVELSPGSKITLTIRPHVLIPDADGENAFNVAEPGFDASLGYQQTSTVGSILANSVRQLDEDAKQLGNAIENLQQLLVSLPNPAVAPPPEPAKPILNRKK
ncbi:MAG: hypothetical protein ACRDBP_00585 [Luteolibacter sp.]